MAYSAAIWRPITLEGLDHLILKPKQLDGVVAVNVDEVLGKVLGGVSPQLDRQCKSVSSGL
jgi:hypothetical protein